MVEKVHDFDCVVVGAGTAGSAAAYHLARAGFRVALLEARALGEAGARWVNGVPSWMFERAGIAKPRHPERFGNGFPFIIQGKNGEGRIKLAESPIGNVDTRLLVARLQDLARKSGVPLFEQIRIQHLDLENDRPMSLTVEAQTPEGSREKMDFRARLFVDATGLSGAVRHLVPELSRHTPPVPRSHLCLAAQEVCAVKDQAGARSFLENNYLRPGESLSFTGVSGGFSALMITLAKNLEEVELLAGAIAEGPHLKGPELLKKTKEENPWIGEVRFGGAGPIPLRRPYDRLAAPGIALVGDAACQVFPAHGSGTGIGMVAARILADSVKGKNDPGSLEATWAYQSAFQREYGGLLASYDVFRRLSQSLSEGEVEALFASGLLTENSCRAGLIEEMPRLSFSELLATLRGAVVAPRLALRLLPALARMPLVASRYRRYPLEPDLDRLKKWSRSVARLFGENPDIN
ncbi:MAG: FAD-dependent oxidoreductase [bacterium]|nr:FAD-dependent oxidoreductase [bacterium]